MDISITKDNGVKIKGKKISIVSDPSSKTEAQIVIITDEKAPVNLENVEDNRLVIEGPGEYEVGGVSITGKYVKGGFLYEIEIDSSKIFFAEEEAASKLQEEDEYDALIVKVKEKLSDNTISALTAKPLILYGNLSQIDLKAEDSLRTSKINLKKQDEFRGKIVLLA